MFLPAAGSIPASVDPLSMVKGSANLPLQISWIMKGNFIVMQLAEQIKLRINPYEQWIFRNIQLERLFLLRHRHFLISAFFS